MAKKQVAVSLRKPPPPADLEALVIQASNEAVESSPKSDVRELRVEAPSADAFVGTKAGSTPGMRAVTVQLPEAVVDRLLAYCRLHERELGDVVAEIIARHLAAQRPDGMLSFEAVIQWVRAQLTFVSSFRARIMDVIRV